MPQLSAISTPRLLAEAVYGDLRGHAFAFSGRRSGERGALASLQQRSYPYPDGLEALQEHLLAQSRAGRDAYLSAHLYGRPSWRGRGRTKGNALDLVWALWVDGDGARVPDALPAPSIVVQSSPGREQFWWLLSRPVAGVVAEELNKRIAYWMGADRSKWCLTTYLRPTGTHNYKRTEPHLVTGLVSPGGRYDPDELDRLLPPISGVLSGSNGRKNVLKRPRGGGSRLIRDHDGATAGPPVPLSADALDAWTGRRTLRTADGDVDRSRTLYSIGRALHDAGADRKTLVAALCERDGALWSSAKYSERPTEYGRIADKLEKERRRRVRREESGSVCDALLEYAFSAPWTGQVGPTDFAVLVSLALEVREHGRVVGDEVRVVIPTREHALLAGLAKHQTVLTSTARLEDEHRLLRRLTRGSLWEGQEYAIPLCTPKDHWSSTGGEAGGVPSGPRVCALLCRFRWRGGRGASSAERLERPFGKLHALVLAKVAAPARRPAHRGVTLDQLSLTLDRPARNLAQRQLAQLVRVGLLADLGDRAYATPSDLASRLERELETTGLVDIERRQRRRYDREREARDAAHAERRYGPPPLPEAEAEAAALDHLRAQGEDERRADRGE